MLKVHVINNPDQFKHLRSGWNTLLSNSHLNTIFLTWEWTYSWWEVFGVNSQLFIITVRNVQDDLVGIAPLFIRKSKYYRFPVREMAFIGTGQADRQDFIIANDHEAEDVSRHIVSTIYQHSKQWDIVNLDQIPEGSSLLLDNLQKDRSACKEHSSVCPYVAIKESWDDYIKSYSKKFKRDLKHKVNRMNRFGKWDFNVERNVADMESLIEAIAKTEEKSRRQGTQKAFFSNMNNKIFIQLFMQHCIDCGWFDCSTIRIDGKPIAYLIGFNYNNKYYAYNMEFSEEYHEASPGKLLLNEKIRWCFENREVVKEFDFLRGDHSIKSLWTDDSRAHSKLILFNRTLLSSLIKYVVFHIRPWIKNIKSREDNLSIKAIDE